MKTIELAYNYGLSPCVTHVSFYSDYQLQISILYVVEHLFSALPMAFVSCVAADKEILLKLSIQLGQIY